MKKIQVPPTTRLSIAASSMMSKLRGSKAAADPRSFTGAAAIFKARAAKANAPPVAERTFSTSASDSELAAFVAREENSWVKVVIINGCSEVTAEGVHAIAKHCTGLQELHAEKVETAGAAAFAELITLRSGSLVLLNLSGCSLGPTGAELIANALKSRYGSMSFIHADSLLTCIFVLPFLLHGVGA
jgi:hypothetical protein